MIHVPEKTVVAMRQAYMSGESATFVAAEFGYSRDVVRRLKRDGDWDLGRMVGSQIRFAITADMRFLRKVRPGGGCLEWVGAKDPTGYGRFKDSGKAHMAHRWSYERWCGPIPDGLVIDHLCRNRACVYVGHLEVVTYGENTKRGECPWAVRMRNEDTGLCINGHAIAEVGLNRKGNCMECARVSSRKKYRSMMADPARSERQREMKRARRARARGIPK